MRSAAKNFYPRPPRGGRRVPALRCCQQAAISIHALREEGDDHVPGMIIKTGDFYPRPPRGGRPPSPFVLCSLCRNFYPRPPRGGRLPPAAAARGARGFLSTPSARRATPDTRQATAYDIISIPALREEGDDRFPLWHHGYSDISIHALREEGDGSGFCFASCRHRFLSTPSARRATGAPGNAFSDLRNFYPRPPRGGRLHPP